MSKRMDIYLHDMHLTYIVWVEKYEENKKLLEQELAIAKTPIERAIARIHYNNR